MKIFVYGTLMSGELRNEVFPNREFVPAFIEGRLVDFGSYPGLLEGDQLVYGELYDVDEETLELLDLIEGVAFGMYERRGVIANTAAGQVKAQSYFCLMDGGEPIPSGNWRKRYD